MCQLQHFKLFLFHFSRLVVRDDNRVVLPLPAYVFFLDRELQSFQVRNVDSFVVLFVCRLQDYLLLLMTNFNDVNVSWVRQIANSPFELVFGIFPLELRVFVVDS